MFSVHYLSPVGMFDQFFYALYLQRASSFWHRRMKKSRCWALPGNTHLLGLHDNQFTWQHRAKNIQTPLKITESKEKRGGGHGGRGVAAVRSHLSHRASRWRYRAGTGSKVRQRKKGNTVFVLIRVMQEEATIHLEGMTGGAAASDITKSLYTGGKRAERAGRLQTEGGRGGQWEE